MKYLSIILIVFWGYTGMVQAQSGYYNQHQQYGKDTNFISYQRYIPEGFLFLVDDTFQQVLANPSKAYLIDSSYVSTTLQNNSGNKSEISRSDKG